MRKVLLALFILTVAASNAQINNSWIDYNKSYYKFKVGKSGLYRINQASLSAIGMGTTPAEYFQLWRNGEEVRIFTSTPTGPLGSSDYIEFWGKMNDGIPDKTLYRKAGFQLSDSFSIHSDTASYFLTINQSATNLRFVNAASDVAANTLAPDAYFFRKVTMAYKNQYNRGYAVLVGEYVYSSSYDMGEGWTSTDAYPCCDLFKEFTGLNVYTAGPANSVSLYISAFGNALNARNLRVKFFNNIAATAPMNFFDTVKKTFPNLPLSLLQNPDYLQVAMNGTSTNPNDRIVIAEMAITYPAKFKFNNQSNFYFDLQPSTNGNYIEIEDFKNAGVAPVLYCLSDGSRYTGDISVAGKVRFALPPSGAVGRKFLLVSEDAGNIASINSLETRNFVNYNLPANQGNYLIISNPLLYNDGTGNNYVDQYKQYRASVAGGGYKSVVVSIEEITDQFAFGIKKHPLAIRDFIRFAYQQYDPKPQYVFLVGRGITSIEYKQNEANPLADKLDLVPTYGWPASDVLLACEQDRNVPLIPIGRLSAINGTEIKNYLNKVIEYEQVQANTIQTINSKEWMKRAIHIIGGADSIENAQFRAYMDGYKTTMEKPGMGLKVETFEKTSASAVEQANGERIQQMINDGVSEIAYFGHSSANTLAFNLSDPQLFNNQGKYPVFCVSGCSAGNFFTFDPLRFSGSMSISEKYVLADKRGSIAFLASTHLGIPPFLNFYNTQLYNNFSRDMYGNTLGNQIKRVLLNLGSNPQSLDFYTRIHLEEMNLHGDPAIKMNSFSLPDYVIEEPQVKINPSILTVADINFTLSVKINNIGKAINDSIRVVINRKLPNDSVQVIFNQLIPAPTNADSLKFTVLINPITDKGRNVFTISIDDGNRVNELSETNNYISREFYIFEDEIRPSYPYNYSIVNQQNITFTASTSNPLSAQRQYLMEIDTTEMFNSGFKKQYSNTGSGGIIQFTPTNISFTDSTVYYWRTSMVPLTNVAPIWNIFSFIYLPNGGTGFNQSHYFQHKNSIYSTNIQLDDDRVFRFKSQNRTLQIKTGLYPATSYDRISVILDFDQFEQYGCKYNSLQFLVYDTIGIQPWNNYNIAGKGRFGSWPVCVKPVRKIFEFPYNDPAFRKKAMDFIDSIPDGYYVSITNLGMESNTSFINSWKADTAVLGAGKSLYHKLKSIGFTTIDSFTRNLPFIYFYSKNNNRYTAQQIMGTTANDQLAGNFIVSAKYRTGNITSPVFGPARSWSSLHWRGKSNDPVQKDSVSIEVYGVKTNGVADLLKTIRPATDTSLAFVNATTYPFIKLRMQNTDNEYATPAQLNYWRINATYIPEGAVAPNMVFRFRDSVEQGDKIDFALAFKNISAVAFDSLRIKFIITDRNNVPHIIMLPKGKALVAGDTLVVNYSIDTRNFPGLNTLHVIVNPDNDQPEQYSYNNFIFKDFFVFEDKTNPLLDVTFDGVHILNRDIVAAKPHVLVKLKDESRFLALSDTSLLKVNIRYPDGNLRRVYFGDTMRFTPSTIGNGDNTASIDYTPYFTEDGEYELIVSGNDVMGNKAGNIEYKVSFSVINTPMISNMLNYPNPFTTSTAFVFTITGSEVPQNIRIQILTITGKVVREITKAELGDLHIGRNITDFKWDGTDMYGQKIANGVYLYRVLTNLNGKSLDKYKADGDKTDKYFKAGYGKMYLMR